MEAIIFDFDGLILDTETAEYQSWQEVYAGFGLELPFALWQENIGTISQFDPYNHLQDMLGQLIDHSIVLPSQQQRNNDLVAQQQILPGVVAYLDEARVLGLKLGIASSSRHDWVDTHLARLGLTARFDVVCCRDDVGDRGKPDPAVYTAAVAALNVAPSRALALEDSPHGAAAAWAAGLNCVAVPNRMTQGMSFPSVVYRLTSLAQMSLAQLLQEIA